MADEQPTTQIKSARAITASGRVSTRALLEEVNLVLAQLNSRLDDLAIDIKDIQRTLNGTPSEPGLTPRILVIEELLRQQEKSKSLMPTKLPEGGDAITWKEVMIRIVLPIGLGFLSWFLFETLPTFIKGVTP